MRATEAKEDGLNMEIWQCGKCGWALGFVDGQRLGQQYGRGRAQLVSLPVRVVCANPDCRAENEREIRERPPSQ